MLFFPNSKSSCVTMNSLIKWIQYTNIQEKNLLNINLKLFHTFVSGEHLNFKLFCLFWVFVFFTFLYILILPGLDAHFTAVDLQPHNYYYYFYFYHHCNFSKEFEQTISPLCKAWSTQSVLLIVSELPTLHHLDFIYLTYFKFMKQMSPPVKIIFVNRQI